MISRHADLVSSFFPEHLILSELRLIRDELRHYRATSFGSPSHSPEQIYLEEVSALAVLLQGDALIAEGSGLVAIDFSEIYSYMETDAALVIGRPLVDYCFSASPVAFSLPPGAAIELKLFTERIRLHQNPAPQLSAIGRELLPLLRDRFVRAYEVSPHSSETEAAYQALLRHVHFAPNAPCSFYGLNRLRHLLRNGRIEPWTFEVAVDGELFKQLYHHFQEIRPSRSFSSFADTLNMVAVEEADRIHGRAARLLSSTPSVRHVAARHFGDSSLIRSSRQLGQLIYIANSCREQEDGAEYYHDRVESIAGSVGTMKRALPVLDEVFNGRSALTNQLARTLTEFALVYRKLLRPVDTMVEAGARALGKRASASIAGLYRSLKSQAELTAAFHIWWEHLCEVASELESYISEHYDTEKLIAAAPEEAREPGTNQASVTGAAATASTASSVLGTERRLQSHGGGDAHRR